jgi:hypothetical protein
MLESSKTTAVDLKDENPLQRFAKVDISSQEMFPKSCIDFNVE